MSDIVPVLYYWCKFDGRLLTTSSLSRIANVVSGLGAGATVRVRVLDFRDSNAIVSRLPRLIGFAIVMIAHVPRNKDKCKWPSLQMGRDNECRSIPNFIRHGKK